jgi:GxxExxY protein
MQGKSKPEIAEGAEINRLTEKIIASAIDIHRHVGPGLLESAYQECLAYELNQGGIRFEREVHLPIQYKTLKLDCSYRLDFLVENTVIVEVKSIDELTKIHSAQLLTYLKAARKQVGLLINFNVPMLKQGLRRLVNHYREPAVAPLNSAPSAVSGVDFEPSSAKPPRLSVSAVNGRLLTPRRPN